MATLKFKRSAVPGKAPTIADIELGEVAINTYDGKLYLKKDDGTQSIVDVGAGGGSAGVSSFNTRTGAVTLTSGDVTGALGFTPYNATNPSGYTSNTGTVTSVDISGGTTGLTASGGPITSSGSITLGGTLNVANGGTGANTLTANAILKGNGTSSISASSITDNGTLVTIAEPVRLSTPNTSSAAWTTSGINLIQSAATFTDTTSSGSVGSVRINNFAAQTLAASNVVSVGTLYGTYFTIPVAGTNVTATTRHALGADSIACNGYFAQTAGADIAATTASITANIGAGATASGNSKAVNIGTGGASGSTTNIRLGSATSGATQTTTINGRVTLAPIGASAAAWTTSGIGLVQSAATFTDTSSTGTVSQVRMNNFEAQTLAASNAVTVSNLYGTYFSDPTAGANVTATNRWGVGIETLRIVNTLSCGGSIAVSGALSLNGPTTTTTATFAAATTASGNTKTVNIGTGGASGSTTNITIGSATSGATSTITLNGGVKTLSAATTSGATITPTADTTNQYNVTALATGATFAAPSGTPVDSQKLMLRIKDNGTGQTLAWNAIYRAIGTTLPTTTTANKTIYVGCVYNSADTKWDVVAVATEA